MIQIFNRNFALKHLIFFLLITSVFALTFAYISQYIFNYQPCVLCLYQRKPFFAIIALSILSLTLLNKDNFKKIALFLSLLLLFTNAIIAFYHVGVEQKIFQGPATCSGSELNKPQNLEALRLALLNAPSVKCDEPQFYLLGLTMAAWNLVLCLFLLLFSLTIYKKVTSAP